jgi:glycosyltransferase involved in cell wall biosynthesis
MRKKRILIHSNFCKAFTGFGKHKKNILKYLFKTGKYEIFEAANGIVDGSPILNKLPWPCYGTSSPNRQNLSNENQQPNNYGVFEIESIVKRVNPDVYIGIEDIWAFSQLPTQTWWNKVNSMVWTTIDSLPLLSGAIDFVPKVDHYCVWASFAQKAFEKIGYNHIKTLRGTLDTSSFFRLSEDQRSSLRDYHGVDKDDFIIGYVFRNQLRKSVPNLIDGFIKFQKEHPKSKLLLHTHWSEGWNIPNLLEEKGVKTKDVLTTYFCSNCNGYKVQPFWGQDLKCPHCQKEKSFNTTNVNKGVSEKQLNEVYNLMDVYCHPFTSGGQEIPIQEAKLAELITLVTNYSCGEDNCTEESGGLPLDWSEYREPGTQFIKASTCPDSINDQLKKVYEMDAQHRAERGKLSRQWVMDNFSVEVVGAALEKMLDSMPLVEDFEFKKERFDEDYPMSKIENVQDFLVDLYDKTLRDRVDKNTTGVKHWASMLESGKMSKEDVHKHFLATAKKENEKLLKMVDFDSLFSEDDEGRRVAVVIPESATDVLLVNSLLKSLQNKHKGYNIYIFTKPEFFVYIEDSPYIHKCLEFSPSIENPQILEGGGPNKGYFEYAYFPHATTQKFPCFIHNGH